MLVDLMSHPLSRRSTVTPTVTPADGSGPSDACPSVKTSPITEFRVCKCARVCVCVCVCVCVSVCVCVCAYAHISILERIFRTCSEQRRQRQGKENLELRSCDGAELATCGQKPDQSLSITVCY